MRRNRQPGKRYELWKSNNGIIDIRVCLKSDRSREEGKPYFYASVEDEGFQDEQLHSLKYKINEYFKAKLEMKALPFILIYKDDSHWRYEDHAIFDITFNRYFFAEHPTAGEKFFKFEPTYPEGKSIRDIPNDDILEGTPGNETRTGHDAKRIPYTPLKWRCLIELKRKHDEVKERLEELLSSDDVDKFLGTLSLNLIENIAQPETSTLDK
jgi:hypothetical protein